MKARRTTNTRRFFFDIGTATTRLRFSGAAASRGGNREVATWDTRNAKEEDIG
jgi:hypothetical protein